MTQDHWVIVLLIVLVGSELWFSIRRVRENLETQLGEKLDRINGILESINDTLKSIEWKQPTIDGLRLERDLDRVIGHLKDISNKP